jgi:hypothetical protein
LDSIFKSFRRGTIKKNGNDEEMQTPGSGGKNKRRREIG